MKIRKEIEQEEEGVGKGGLMQFVITQKGNRNHKNAAWSTNTYRVPASSRPSRWAGRGMAPAVANRKREALYRKLWWPRPHHYCCTPSPSVSSSPVAYRLTPSTECRWEAAKREREEGGGSS